MPWTKSKGEQLDLLDSDPAVKVSATPAPPRPSSSSGRPLFVATSGLDEDPNNPRTELLEDELAELTEDIRQRGILQPIVVHPPNAAGRYRIHFGARRWRAAQLAGLDRVPIVVRDAPADPYAHVAENQKRHGLTPLDLARFIQGRIETGESNSDVARRLGMNLTTVAHHLALLELPPPLDQALRTGRCTSPRTLHELSKLHEVEPARVRALVHSDAEITRATVAEIKADSNAPAAKPKVARQADALARAHAACDRLERALARIDGPPPHTVALPELVALRIRVEDIPRKWLWGSDRQTPSGEPGSDSPTPARPT